MRSLCGSLLLTVSLVAACSKPAKSTTPPSAKVPAAAASEPATAQPAPPATSPPSHAAAEPPPAASSAPAVPRPAGVTDEDVSFFERTLAVFGDLAAGVEKAGKSCPGVAAAVRAVTPKVNALIDEGGAVDKRMAKIPAAKAWIDETYTPRLMTILRQFMSNPCMSDPEVSAAVGALNVSG